MSEFIRGMIVGMMIIGTASLVSGISDDNAHGEIVFGVALFAVFALIITKPRTKASGTPAGENEPGSSANRSPK